MKPNTISFMVGLSSKMQHQEPSGLNIKSLLVQVKPSVQRSNVKNGCISCVEVAQYHSDNGVFTAAEF